MTPESVALLDKLASKLGVTVEYLWSVLLRQAPIEAAIMGVYGIVLVVAWRGLYRLCKYRPTPYDEDQFAGHIFFCVVAGVVVGVSTLIWTLSIGYDVLTALANPEYWALKKIMGTIK